MRAFIRGWRRKIGCGLLALAVLLSCAWGATANVSAFAEYDYGEWQYHVHTTEHEYSVWWYKPHAGARTRQFEWYTTWYSPRVVEYLKLSYEAQREVYSGRFLGCGFSNQGRDPDSYPTDFRELNVSHWSVILPTTLIAAVLILWRPRTRKLAVA